MVTATGGTSSGDSHLHTIDTYQAHEHDTHNNSHTHTTAKEKEEYNLTCMVEKIFGYDLGQTVSHQNGLNEFLSAIIAVRELAPILPLQTLAKIACCIEATIPFRPVDKQTGKNCLEKLFDKMTLVNQEFNLGLSHDEIVDCIQRAADLCNADVLNFGTGDVFWFLDNTWSLLPESNEGLRRSHLYTVQQFQFAVFKMYGFFCFLQPPVIFPSFRNFPSPETTNDRIRHAGNNLQVGRKYVGAKLLSLSLLAAVAELTGGDAPISLFMGDLPSRHTGLASPPIGQTGKNDTNIARKSITASLVPVTVDDLEEDDDDDDNKNDKNGGAKKTNGDDDDHDNNDDEEEPPFYDDNVYEVLSKGRRTETSFDVRQSPLAASFYKALGDKELKQLLLDIKVYPMTPDTAWAFLRRLPREIVTGVIEKLSFTAISRTEKILDLLEKL